MCPKCKTGSLSRVSINSTNWRCNFCGYTEYRPSSGVDMSSASVNSAYSSFNSAADDVEDALRRRKAASREYDRIRKERKQEKDGKGGWLTVVIVVIVVYILLNN